MIITRRNLMLLGAGAIAAPYLSRTAGAQGAAAVKVGTVLAGTTMAAQLLPKYLGQVGIKVDVVPFTNLTQLMQAIASDDIQLGYGGINAAISIAGRGMPISLLANACEGGWRLVGKPDIKDLNGLKGKKVAVQAGNMCHVALGWKLKSLGIDKDVELVFMSNSDMPIPMQQGQVDAIFGIEPYPSFAVANGWAHEIWQGYDTPVGKVNLGFVGSSTFVQKNTDLARAVVRAHEQATAELKADKTVAIEFTAKFLNMKREIVATAMENMFFTTEVSGAFIEKVKILGDMMISAKFAQKLPEWGDFINTSLVSKA